MLSSINKVQLNKNNVSVNNMNATMLDLEKSVQYFKVRTQEKKKSQVKTQQGCLNNIAVIPITYHISDNTLFLSWVKYTFCNIN